MTGVVESGNLEGVRENARRPTFDAAEFPPESFKHSALRSVPRETSLTWRQLNSDCLVLTFFGARTPTLVAVGKEA